MTIQLEIATKDHWSYAESICALYAASAKERGTGIAKREPEYIRQKMEQQNAIIALQGKELAGFCYIETWTHAKYVANSGLIVDPKFRGMGLGKQLKTRVFNYARDKYPKAKVFGITTSLAVMNMNHSLGYKPVTFSELTQDEAFWKGCQSCPNYDILERNQRKLCLCTGMLAPSKEEAMAVDLGNLIVENNK